MPIICTFRGIKIYINYSDHMPPHFHAYYGEYECCIDIDEIEKLNGNMPNKQLKMLLGWAALHQEELKENWYLARQKETLFTIEPLKQGDLCMDERVKKYFENPRKIMHVKPDVNYTLLITFENGEVKKYEMANELYGIFEILKDVKKFESVFIDEVGNIAWDIDENVDSSTHWQNRIDLCKDMLYLESI